MLKELNKIAAGLLGLHGYPTQPWTAVDKDVAAAPKPAPANRCSREGKTHRAVTRPRLAARAWR